MKRLIFVFAVVVLITGASALMTLTREDKMCAAQQPVTHQQPTSEKSVHAAKADLKQLQGKWRVVKATENGKPLTGPLSEIRVIVEDNRVRCQLGSMTVAKGTVDPNKTPNQIDLQHEWTGAKMIGIYQQEGDQLKVHLSKGDTGPRPTDFVNRPTDKGRFLLVLEREKS